MDTLSSEEIVRAAQITGILSGIVLVIFALWAEYFCGLLEEDLLENPVDPKLTTTSDEFQSLVSRERNLVHLVASGAFIVQALNFLLATVARENYPLLCLFGFGAVLLIQGRIQSKTEDRILSLYLPKTTLEHTPAQLHEAMKGQNVGKSVFWVSISVFSYFLTLYASLGLSIVIGKYLGLSHGGIALLVTGSVLFGIFVALTLHFMVAPKLMEKIYHAKKFTENLTLFQECFRAAHLNCPPVMIIEDPLNKIPNAFVAGFLEKPAIFQKSLFISRGLLTQMNTDQLKAVIYHEISHIVLKHLRSRLLWIVGSLFGSVILSVLLVATSKVFFQNSAIFEILRIGASALCFVSAFKTVKSVIKSQEFEADAYAVTHFKTPAHALIGALEATAAHSVPGLHPDSKDRIAALKLLTIEPQTSTEDFSKAA